MLTIKTMNYVSEKLRNEEGEVASWLILAAGLATAAVAASGKLNTIIGALADKVGQKAGVGA